MRNRQAHLQNLEFLGGLFGVRIPLLERSHMAGRNGSVTLCSDSRELKIKRDEAAGAEVLQDLR
jgi:hypothetical protein